MVAACAVRAALFSWRFIIPLVIFVLCYWRIISTLRRRAKVGVGQRQQSVAAPSTSTAAPRSTSHSKHPSKAQKNVIKTMIAVISCFIVCWLPVQFTMVAQLCGLRSMSSPTFFFAFAVLAFVNLCAHPFIYATGMFQFLRDKCFAAFRRLVGRGNQVADVVEEHTGTSSRRINVASSRV